MRVVRALLFIALLPTPSPAPFAATQNLAPGITSLLAAGSIPGSQTPVERELLSSLYPPDAPHPLWIDHLGGLTGAGRQAVELLAGAGSHGLDPSHYRVGTNQSDLATLDAATAAMPLLGDYEGLRDGLAWYRALASSPALPALPANSRSIHVGEPLPWGAALRAHLVAFGDLAPSAGGALFIPMYRLAAFDTTFARRCLRSR